MILPNMLTQRRQSQLLVLSTYGTLMVILLGVLTSIALLFGALWLLVQFATLTMESAIEALNTVGALYQQSDPLIRFVLLVSISFCVYKVVRGVLIRKGVLQ